MSTRNAVIPQLLNDPETIEAPQQKPLETPDSQDTGGTSSEYRVVCTTTISKEWTKSFCSFKKPPAAT
jgi:hypothetical protein